MKSKQPTFEDRKAAARRAALRGLKKARRAAETSGVKLSDWEGEFLGSVETRIEKYGRAFRDPEKGGPGSSLSVRQAFKLKEIVAKAKLKPKGAMRRGGFRRGP
ncbi:MAG: hypothetical protein WDM81_16410 [Rhizomicrobium sp.]